RSNACESDTPSFLRENSQVEVVAGALEPDERALRLREWLGRLLRRDDATDLVVVPRRGGLAWRLHLSQEKIVHQPPILAHLAPWQRSRPPAGRASAPQPLHPR